MKKMVSSCSQREMALSRKLLLLRSLTNSKSHCKTAIIMDALDYIQELKTRVDRLKKEYGNPKQQQVGVPMEVTVERVEMGFVVRVSCEKSKDLLASLVEALEELGLNVLHAKVSCKHSFWMEALVHGVKMDVSHVKQTLLETIKNVVERPALEVVVNNGQT